MIIPTQLWEETKKTETSVFSKLPLAQYVSLMNKVVTNLSPKNLVISKASVYTSSIISHGLQYAIRVYTLFVL